MSKAKLLIGTLFIAFIVVLIGISGVLDPVSSASKEVDKPNLQVGLLEVDNYLDFSEVALAGAQQKGQTILFFAATTWCQSCSHLEQEILQRSSELPTEVTILKVDFDNDTEMKTKFAVPVQHTLVVLDQEGQEVSRWVGGDFDELVRRLGEVE